MVIHQVVTELSGAAPQPTGHTSFADRMRIHVELSVDAQRKITPGGVLGGLPR
jgi:hypothetical protein